MVRVAILLAALAASAGPASAATATGVLAGKTQISFGCPGPARAEGPPCELWHAFAGATFTVTGVGGRVRRVVVSDASGSFRLRLPAGSYVLTGTKQRNALPGPPVYVRVRRGAVTTAAVRFDGFPKMY